MIYVHDFNYSLDEEVLTISIDKNNIHLVGSNKNYERFYPKIESEIKKYLKEVIL